MDQPTVQELINEKEARVNAVVDTLFSDLNFEIWKCRMQIHLLENTSIRYDLGKKIKEKMDTTLNLIENKVTRHV